MPAPVPRKPLVFSVLAGAALAWSGAAAAGNGGIAPVPPQSPNAGRIDDVYWLLVGVAVFIFLVVTIPLVVFVVRYRSNGRPRTVEGPQIRGNTNLEVGWTAGAALILVVIAAFVFYKLPGIQNPDDAGAAGELRLQVEGRQFYWQYRYPNGAIAIDRLRAPADQVVRLELTAPDADVNHSFWVPALGGKFDAIPGTTNETWFRARRPGVYRGVCAEFCGIQHALMRAAVEVMPRAEFDRWVQERADDPAELGEEQWNGVCAKCHRLGGEPQLVGPSLGQAALANEETLETIVRNGRGAMPAVGRGWTDEQMDALLEYIARLAEQAGDGA
jgi:cytochrome c oxidase subunit 2